MDKIETDFKEKGVIFYNLFTREPHPGQDTRGKDKETGERTGDAQYGFTNIPQTKSMEEREDYVFSIKLVDFLSICYIQSVQLKFYHTYFK